LPHTKSSARRLQGHSPILVLRFCSILDTLIGYLLCHRHRWSCRKMFYCRHKIPAKKATQIEFKHKDSIKHKIYVKMGIYVFKLAKHGMHVFFLECGFKTLFSIFCAETFRMSPHMFNSDRRNLSYALKNIFYLGESPGCGPNPEHLHWKNLASIVVANEVFVDTGIASKFFLISEISCTMQANYLLSIFFYQTRGNFDSPAAK
jgi:hypothetical protein